MDGVEETVVMVGGILTGRRQGGATPEESEVVVG